MSSSLSDGSDGVDQERRVTDVTTEATPSCAAELLLLLASARLGGAPPP